MGLFSRRANQPEDDTPVPDDSGRMPLVPTALPLRDGDAALRDRCLAELASAGVDLGDLEVIGKAHDADLTAWRALPERRRDDHAAHIERWGVAIGEHLTRCTDLRWTTVADPFGTDLGLMAGGEASLSDEFALVPTNLVSGRWLNGETGWIPGVVGHLVTLRTA